MDFATLSRYLLARPTPPPPGWAAFRSAAVLLAAAALVLVAWVAAAQLDPDLTGSWRWSDSVRLLA